jgi:Zn-dependent metalloprotease
VSANAAALGLASSDLGSLRLARDYVDIGGTHHLSWVQYASGIPLFGNGLKANVASDGRLINVLGSPVSGLSAPSTSPGIDASQALATAKTQIEATLIPVEGIDAGDSTHTTTFTGGDTASLVLFQTVSGTRLAWQTTVNAEQDSFVHVIDAQTGRVLYRRSLVNYANPATRRYGSSIRTPPGRPRPARSATSTCRRGCPQDRRP